MKTKTITISLTDEQYTHLENLAEWAKKQSKGLSDATPTTTARTCMLLGFYELSKGNCPKWNPDLKLTKNT